mmetsp:Transcript_12312/g.45890  ORF Transcript_12312/g.45890 Transcript_12312/m.45890 type:complete len:222 (+) Transcript_12312:1057-1722(+)
MKIQGGAKVLQVLQVLQLSTQAPLEVSTRICFGGITICRARLTWINTEWGLSAGLVPALVPTRCRVRLPTQQYTRLSANQTPRSRASRTATRSFWWGTTFGGQTREGRLRDGRFCCGGWRTNLTAVKLTKTSVAASLRQTREIRSIICGSGGPRLRSTLKARSVYETHVQGMTRGTLLKLLSVTSRDETRPRKSAVLSSRTRTPSRPPKTRGSGVSWRVGR